MVDRHDKIRISSIRESVMSFYRSSSKILFTVTSYQLVLCSATIIVEVPKKFALSSQEKRLGDSDLSTSGRVVMLESASIRRGCT